ncbi:hypothetical protein HDU84_003082 [Entophlyctis sp. JEL0112]|nr:hypothetical protein HDU84_003082 [Entophlyctis sp. JEL0112]
MSNATSAAEAAALSAALQSLTPAQQAEAVTLSSAQLLELLHAPARLLTNGQLLTILLYLYAIGVFLCGAIVLATLIDPKRLLRTTTDRLTMGLVSTCFMWAVGRAVIHALEGVDQLSFQNQGAAAFSNIMILLLFALNSHLAMERYFQVMEQPYGRHFLALLWSFFGLTTAIVLWMFSSSPTSDGIKPDNSPHQTIWLALLCGQYLTTSIVMTWFYVRTYRYSAKQFAENPDLATFFMKDKDGYTDDPEVLELVRLRVEREILTKCVALSATVMVLYAPFLTYQIQSYVVGPIPFFDMTAVYYDISVILVALDVIVTPLLVFFFKREVREAFIFWK